MDKGIRQGVLVKFAAMLPELATLGGKKFRRILLDWTVENYSCSMAAASTHYNFAFQKAKKETPELVVGLGRPEGKNNGGRKKKATVVGEVTTPTTTVPGAMITDAGAQTEAQAAEAAASTEGAEEGTSEVAPADAEQAAPEVVQEVAPEASTEAPLEAVVEKLYSVSKADGTVVATDLTLEAAEKLIAKAKKAKKSLKLVD